MTGTVLFWGLWLGKIFGLGPLQDAPLGVYLLLSAAYGYLVRRWWAPLSVFCLLPALAIPEAYGDSNPNYSNGAAAALAALVVVAPVVTLGVMLARFTKWLSARGT